MKRGAKNEASLDGVIAKKARCPNWCQQDTDLMCKLVREIGLKSVLNMRTNGTTPEIKKADWNSISEAFNAHPSVCFICVFIIIFYY